MATFYSLLPEALPYYDELQSFTDGAEECRLHRFKAVMLLIRMTRGHLIRKHVKWLSFNATIIQCAFRCYLARKAFRAALRRAVRNAHAKHYARAATIVQCLWRGHYSRRTQFCYRKYRHWLAIVKERGERRAAEAAEFGVRSRADDLKILEEEARQWLAFVVFKLHHLLRTYACAGVYSDPITTEFSEFEKLLKSIHYLEYMKRLKRKYDEFVKKHRPSFSNKKLFPIIGYGADYWYLSLPEMYELTSATSKKDPNYRHSQTHHGMMHEKPFIWRRFRPEGLEPSRGPFPQPKLETFPKAPAPTPVQIAKRHITKDPRFNLYVRYYKPEPALFDYVNYHINVLLRRKASIEDIC